jgi:DNA-binding IclR family transcriptional regulator
MLAALPAAQIRALFPDASSFTDRTGRGPVTPAALREVLRRVRADGFASEDGEITLGLRSVGVAVLDHAGWPVAAVATTWPEDGQRDAASLVPAVRSAASELQRRLYGR